jgi:hypothetical protein
MTSQAHPLCTGSVSRVALFAAISIYWQIFFWKSKYDLAWMELLMPKAVLFLIGAGKHNRGSRRLDLLVCIITRL